MPCSALDFGEGIEVENIDSRGHPGDLRIRNEKKTQHNNTAQSVESGGDRVGCIARAVYDATRSSIALCLICRTGQKL